MGWGGVGRGGGLKVSFMRACSTPFMIQLQKQLGSVCYEVFQSVLWQCFALFENNFKLTYMNYRLLH